MLGLPVERAAAGLDRVIASGRLGEVSNHAYGAGVAVLTRVGPFGDVPGLAKTVQVHLLRPRKRPAGVMYALRWVATGPAETLFPALDADLALTRAGADATRLSITASYRPPLGTLGRHLDHLLLDRVAHGTIRSFLGNLAQAIIQPDPSPPSAAEQHPHPPEVGQDEQG